MDTSEIKLVTGEMMRIPTADAAKLASRADRFVRVTAVNADGSVVGEFEVNADSIVWMRPAAP